MRAALTAFLWLTGLPAALADPWQSLATGLELGRFAASHQSRLGDSTITVLRINPRYWELQFHGIAQSGAPAGKTARQWSRDHELTAVINAGMFDLDRRTHIGYLRARDQVYSARINSYQSVAAFDPRDNALPAFRIFDLDEAGIDSVLRDYASAVQNLRLIKRPGENRWSPQERKWSEAALGEDDSGRLLFIFSRSPFSMYELNHELLRLDIGLVAAQHLEGGPEAQLYLRVGDFELELWGSYETSFMESDANTAAWPIPNVLGIRARDAGGPD